jgi:2-phospho-L-lactate guanylyltransferase
VHAAVVVPVKAFADAKARLAPVLDEASRAALARWCAARVLAAAGPLDRFVVCDDPGVAAWATAAGAHPILVAEPGLNQAVAASVRRVRDAGYDIAVVVHGDLPLARRLGHVLDGTGAGPGASPCVSLVPDHRYDGTNVLALPTALADTFAFHYGRGSFRRHLREALRCGAAVRVLRDDELAQDLDTPSDLADDRMEEVRAWLRTSPASPR